MPGGVGGARSIVTGPYPDFAQTVFSLGSHGPVPVDDECRMASRFDL